MLYQNEYRARLRPKPFIVFPSFTWGAEQRQQTTKLRLLKDESYKINLASICWRCGKLGRFRSDTTVQFKNTGGRICKVECVNKCRRDEIYANIK